MSVPERRKKAVNIDESAGPAFIEIQHTFGPVRKSVYKVVEFNEHGTSFLMPATDGYFRSGQPLEFSLITPELAKIESGGVVRDCCPYNDKEGRSYYKIGLENKKLAPASRPKSFRIRPERLNLADLESEHTIYFFMDDREYELPLADMSRYSAAFLCSEAEAFPFGAGNVLDGIKITAGSRLIFEGTVMVTRRSLEDDRYRIVIEPRGAVFNIDTVEEQERLTSIARCVDSLRLSSKKHREIPKEFKSIVSDMRLFLEGFQEILDSPTAAKPSTKAEQEVFLDELSGAFYAGYDAFWADLEKLVLSLEPNDAQQSLYKTYLQSHLHPLILSAPICHRIYYKPLGYPGDFEMMRMIRDNLYDGPTLFTKLVHAHALRNPMARANRNRIEYLCDKIAAFVESRPNEEVRIFSIAAGPALEIQHLIETKPHIADRIHLTLLDQEIEALRYSQDSIYMKRIMRNCKIKVDLIHQSVGSFLKQIARGKGDFPSFDMIYIFGLFDYFDDRTCAFCMNKSAALLTDGGKMIVSNYSMDGHHHRTFMEYAFEWFMVYRNLQQMQKLADLIKKPCAAKADEEPLGVIKFLELDFEVTH
jgi:extracellular factor (EF) 3-hydroxypalmitic acid methyl ester biosynthesis protein